MRSIGSDWTEYMTSSRVYYSNTVAKEKTWKLPRRDGATLNIQEGSTAENNRSRNQNHDNIGRLLRTGVLKIKQETASCKWVKSTIVLTELHVLVTWLLVAVLVNQRKKFKTNENVLPPCSSVEGRTHKNRVN
ncbi:hypothetical protein RUM44_003207 [Polyplax serrata]|uniref:WW domain-containing protein n=1 Tax=Polyplax serrata TaxID=468196 RepID=A0ABR1AXU6_POLSC